MSCHHDDKAYLSYLQRIWPRGLVYLRKPELIVSKLLHGIADGAADFNAWLCDRLRKNINPCEADICRDDWLTTTGVRSDPCMTDIDECTAMLNVLRGHCPETEGQEVEYYICLLVAYGVRREDIEIIQGGCHMEWGDFSWGDDCANWLPEPEQRKTGWGSGDFNWGELNWGGLLDDEGLKHAHEFIWRVRIKNAETYPGYYCSTARWGEFNWGEFGWGDDTGCHIPFVECLINRDKPAHTAVFFEYQQGN